MAADYPFDIRAVYNVDTNQLARLASGYLLDRVGGDPQAMYDTNGSPITELLSNEQGICQRFRADILRGVVVFGDIQIPVVSEDLYDLAEAAQGLAATATQAAADAAAGAAAAQAAYQQLQTLIANEGGGTGGGLDETALSALLGGAPGAVDGLIPKLAVARIQSSNGTWPAKPSIGAATIISIGTSDPGDLTMDGEIFVEAAL